MLDTNIVLIGFMGSGKSSVGLALSKALNRPFINTDDIIEEKEGMKIREIFEKKRERYFREREREVVKEVSALKGCVVATGGGVVLNWENVEALKKNGKVFFLKAKPDVIYERIKHNRERPLLNVPSPILAIKKILKLRMPLYRKAADYIIDTSKLSIEEVVEKIKEELK